MRNKLLRLLLLAAMFLLVCCQAEDTALGAHRHGKIISKKVSYQEMLSIMGPQENLERFVRNKGTDYQKKLLYDEKNGFWVDTDLIIMKQMGDKVCFTIPVIRDEETSKVENLVLNLRETGDYSVMMFKYSLTPDERKKAAEGQPIDDLGSKTEVDYLKDEKSGGYSGDIIKDADGHCYRVDHITETADYFIITYIEVKCPPEAPADPSYTDGEHNGGGGGAIPVWYPVPVHGGGDNGPVGPSGPGGSGGGTDPDDPDEPIITAPVPLPIIKTPCEQLEEMGDPDKMNLKESVDWLKSIVNAPVNDMEQGVEVKKVMNPDESYNYPQAHVAPGETFQVDFDLGVQHIGTLHSHPTDGYAMFSFEDILLLLGTYKAVGNTRQSEVFITVVCKHPVTQVVSVYTLKIKNVFKLDMMVQEMMEKSSYASLNERDKLDKIYADQARMFDAKRNNLEQVFLKQFGSFGISLYKANDDSLTNWSELKLSETSSLTVNSIPCN